MKLRQIALGPRIKLGPDWRTLSALIIAQTNIAQINHLKDFDNLENSLGPSGRLQGKEWSLSAAAVDLGKGRHSTQCLNALDDERGSRNTRGDASYHCSKGEENHGRSLFAA